ncbi:hypothetical protein Pla144_39030 [Bythopirellula polymerisocia]|uniref:Uncharacterized protein n=2 Tax=Bythopirellula polymerisocia TaxID=2528003 RepID=A0A5C6CH96_9BACT|nr:hypothetical protein Pla144_39030 [Bythopirellula polymerisocia]
MRHAMEDLQRAWQEVSESWQDQVSQQFSQQYLEPLIPVTKRTLDAISRMQDLTKKMQRDCES